MGRARLAQAMADGLVPLPESGPVVVFNAPADGEYPGIAPERLVPVQWMRPEHDGLRARALAPVADPADLPGGEGGGSFAAAIVHAPRARDLARALVARAVAAVAPGAPVLVDGQKTDGIESLLRAIRTRVAPDGIWSRAHGKLAWFSGGDFADWTDAPRRIEGGFVTRPGVFSANAPDKGSVLLRAALPGDLAGRGADLGAGWGYLAREILTRPGVEALDLVEADRRALDCARENVADARARFHWADATRWGAGGDLDFVVMNPPFHVGRRGSPELGRAFIGAAARALGPRGRLWMVANRHLPYENDLAAVFRVVEELPGTAGFKLLHARRPRPGR